MSIAFQLRVAIGALILLLAAILAAAFYVPYELNAEANDRYVRDAIPLKALVADVTQEMATQEAVVQAYIVTGDRSTLERYFASVAAVNDDLARMTPHLRKHPRLDRLVQRAVPQISSLQGLFERQIAAVPEGKGLRSDRAQIQEVDRAFTRFSATADQMLRETDRFVAAAERDQRATYRRLLVTLAILGIAAGVISVVLLVATPRRIGELYDAEQGSRREAESRAEAARALEHVGDAVILTDGDGHVRFWNPAAAKLTEIEQSSAVGRSLTSIFPEFAEFTRTRPGGGRHAAVLPVRLLAGERWLSITSVDFGEGAVYAARDVTEEHLLETMRTDFVATASHELRTPMTSIYGAARTLLSRGYDLSADRRGTLLEMIATESERLARIVDDILLASRLESHSVPVTTEASDAVDLVRSAIDAAKLRAPAHISLDLRAPADLPPVACDPDRFRQVLLNLLDNAIKYSPDGGEVRVVLEPNGEALRFAVHDEGLGFPPAERERIFERFHRLDPQQSRGIGGTGLGLYISRELVERMGGSMWAESTPGHGSSFFFELPLAEERVSSEK